MGFVLMPFPTRIHIESTNVCNLDCLFCPYGRQQREKGYVGMDLYQKIIDECKGHQPKLWLHFLGEPLLHRDLPAMVAYAKAQGLPQVGFSTNAFFLTPELGEQLIRAGLDRLECSVDGVDPASYQHLRRSQEFSRVVANIQGFLQQRKALGADLPVVTIQFMRTPETRAFLPQAQAFWRPLLGARDFLMTIADISFAGEMRGARYRGGREPCKWLWHYLVVLWNGDVVTCVSDYDGTRVMGNVKEQSLADIWSNPLYVDLRRKHLEGRFAEGGICAGCDDWALADGHGYQNVAEEKT
ncbi:MAG: SPASM domain-containing protein [Nitrospinae bacterium]|nr:SPASM domain-containing protein [Nitrospinota bacterium]